jgi:hypothetical protein
MKNRLLKKRSNGIKKSTEVSHGDSPTSSFDDSWVRDASDAASGDEKYHDEEAVPDLAISCGTVDDACGPATLDSAANEYGYEVAIPSTSRIPRRSSLKGANGPRSLRRHSISFSEQVIVTPVVPTTEMVKKKSDLWLQGEDYARIMTKVHTIADRAADGGGPKYCTRGLEALILNEEDPQRYEACDAVLDEQWNQVRNGIYDDKALSRIYKLSSISSKMEAKLRGLQDAKDIRKYTFDSRQHCRRMSM